MLKIDRLGVLAALIDEKSMGSFKIECLVLNLSCGNGKMAEKRLGNGFAG